MHLVAKRADSSDWQKLQAFYQKIYKPGHPLQNQAFWSWQYGNPEQGSAFVVLDEERVYGHVGAYYVDGYAWMINVYMDELLRGQGWVGKLYKMARAVGFPLAATSANVAGLGLYRKMKWTRYANLERWVLINPEYTGTIATELLTPASIQSMPAATDHYYWQQPGINGIQLPDGSTGVMQSQVGGLRVVDIVNVQQAATEAFNAGFKWCDFVASWNDPMNDVLAGAGWINQQDCAFPWYLSPVDPAKKFLVSFLSEEPIDKHFTIKRYHSDHGRVGSLAD